jgi:MtN3 and saliva related transmembrane protein
MDSAAFALLGEAVGVLAAVLTTLSILPQFLKAWRSKSTKDISLSMFAMMVLGVFCWFVYGLYMGSLQIIIANLITFSLSLGVLYCKLKYG